MLVKQYEYIKLIVKTSNVTKTLIQYITFHTHIIAIIRTSGTAFIVIDYMP